MLFECYVIFRFNATPLFVRLVFIDHSTACLVEQTRLLMNMNGASALPELHAKAAQQVSK